jgi:four helix bundle protein
MGAKSFEELIVWQKAHQLVLLSYQISAAFPKAELYGLTSQMRRAAVSVPANIAEGFKKRGWADKARYLNTAQGSLEELRYYSILARDLGYLNGEELASLLSEVSRLLEAYHCSLLRNHNRN